MNIVNRCRVPLWLLALALFFTGCATPQADVNAARNTDFRQIQVAVFEKYDASEYCANRRSELGCALRLRGTNKCLVLVKSGLSEAVRGQFLFSEMKRCHAPAGTV